MIDKMIPESQEAELAVISGLLLPYNEDVGEIVDSLTADHFWSKSNQIIFSTICEMQRKGEKVDSITLMDRLKVKGLLEDIGGQYYLFKIATSNPLASHAMDYVPILKEKLLLRKAIAIGQDLYTKAFNGDDPKEIISQIEGRLFELSIESSNNQNNKTHVAANELQRMIDVRKSGQTITGLQSGIHFIDKIFGGLQKTQYYVLAGRPSSGKSAMADQITMNVVMKDNPVLYIALEGSTERVYSKIACKMVDVCYWDFSRNAISNEDLIRVERAGKLLEQKPLILVRPSSMNPQEIKSIVKRYAKKHDLKLVVLDFLQKVHVPHGWDERRAISEASHAIQDACVETGIPGLIIAQLNRESEKEGRPRMRHLKESGDIEQDADNVILLWSEQDPRDLEPGQMLEVNCTIEKNKDGVMGVDERMLFDRRIMKFRAKSNEREFNEQL